MIYFKDEDSRVHAIETDEDIAYLQELHAGTLLTPISESEALSLADSFTPSEAEFVTIEQQKQLDIEGLTVTVGDLVFQANDKSIGRMSAAVLSAEHFGLSETQWVMADGTVSVVTLAQLKEASALAIQSIGAILLN